MLRLTFPIRLLSYTRYAKGSLALKDTSEILVPTDYILCFAFYSLSLTLGAATLSSLILSTLGAVRIRIVTPGGNFTVRIF
jgi:hypothetical protein